MSREKQIEEMAFDLYLIDTCKHLTQAECNNTTCAHCEAEALYNAGYRKQSEGEWVDKYHWKYANQLYKCSVCGATAHSDDRGHWFLTPYCPNCGAKMKGGE